MKEGWKRVSLEEIATEMYRGSGIKRDQVTSSGCPCVRYGEIYTSYNYSFENCLSHTDEDKISPKKYFEYGDILFAITGESVEDIGKSIAYLGHEKCLCGGDIVVMKHGQNPKCLAYALATQDAVKQKGFGKTKLKVVHTNVPSLKSIKVNLPQSLSAQQSIVTYLDTSFSLIDSLAENAKKALENAKALFQAELNDLISESKIDSIHSLEEIATDMYRGAGIKRDQVTEEGISCVRYGEIYTSYNYHFDTCKSHTNEDVITSKKYFEHGDILFAITGESVEEIGKSIAYMGHEKCLSGGDIVVMKHNQNPRYLSYALATDSAIRQKGFGKTKLKVVHTNVPSLKAIRVPIPSLEEQEQIANTLDTLSQYISQLEQNYNKTLDNCQALKQALLRETFE